MKNLFNTQSCEAGALLLDLVDPLEKLMGDKNFGNVLSKVCGLAKMNPPAVVFYPLALVAIKPLLKDHTNDLLALAAVLIGKPYEEVREQTLMQTMHDLRGVNCEELVDFFGLSADTGREK